ncbi:hypothetical protein D3C83_260880 [compost metagenome]
MRLAHDPAGEDEVIQKPRADQHGNENKQRADLGKERERVEHGIDAHDGQDRALDVFGDRAEKP